MVLLVVVLGPRLEFEIQVVPGSEYEIQVGTELRFGFTIGSGPFLVAEMGVGSICCV